MQWIQQVPPIRGQCTFAGFLIRWIRSLRGLASLTLPDPDLVLRFCQKASRMARSIRSKALQVSPGIFQMILLAISKVGSFRLGHVILFAGLLLSAKGFCVEDRPPPPKSEWLMEAGWLNEHLKDRIIIADTRTEQEYLQGHIPGAVWLDLSGLGARTSESVLPLLHQELAAKFTTLGITGAEQV